MMEDNWSSVDTFRTGYLSDEYRFVWQIENFKAVLDAISADDNDEVDDLIEKEKVSFETGHKIGCVTNWNVYMERGRCNCAHSWILLTAKHGPLKKNGDERLLLASLEVEKAEGCTLYKKQSAVNFTAENRGDVEIGIQLFQQSEDMLKSLQENQGRIKLFLKLKLLITYNWNEENMEILEERERQAFLTNIAHQRPTESGASSDMFDVKIQVNGSQSTIGAHRAILAARSPVFAKMFQSGMKEAVTGLVEIGDLSKKAMEVLLYFVYNGTLHKTWGDIVDEIVYAADKYELLGLTSLVNQRMINLCNADNAQELLELATTFTGLGKAKADLEKFLQR